MPTEISLHILDDRDPRFKELLADLEEMVNYEHSERIDFEKHQDIHDYLQDKFSNQPEMNQGYWPRNLGTLQNVIDSLEKDINHVEQGGALDDQFDLLYLKRDLDYTALMREVVSLRDELKAQQHIPHKHVALIWW